MGPSFVIRNTKMNKDLSYAILKSPCGAQHKVYYPEMNRLVGWFKSGDQSSLVDFIVPSVSSRTLGYAVGFIPVAIDGVSQDIPTSATGYSQAGATLTVYLRDREEPIVLKG